MKYKFPQFNTEITDPIITVQSVTDNLNEKTCSVDILLTTESAKFGVNLSGFEYVDTWEDADVYAWAIKELEKYSV